MIRKSLARITKKPREILERKHSRGWFKSSFNSSPWLTTLIYTLMGPLLILNFIFGPYKCGGLQVSYLEDPRLGLQTIIGRRE